MIFKFLLKPILLLLTIFVFTNSVVAQTATIHNKTDKLRVGISGGEPFVFQESNTGISLEIWKRIAEKESWDYEFVHYKSVEEALNGLKKDTVDLVVGPISITAKRSETMRFSQPFYNSSISIISRIENKGIWGKIKPIFSFKLLIAVGIFLIILVVVGTFFWLAERKKSPEQFSPDPVKGIGTGMWLAIVTMSTTGYGDNAPITLLGRIIAGTWMIISIIFATSMVAGIASTLTLSNIGSTVTNIEQLSGKKVATVAGSPSEEFLNKANLKVIETITLEEAILKLENKNVDAVVFDRPQLLYFLKENDKEDLYISRAEYFKQGYGFAFPLESQLIYKVNHALLELAEDQEIEEIIHTFIKKDE